MDIRRRVLTNLLGGGGSMKWTILLNVDYTKVTAGIIEYSIPSKYNELFYHVRSADSTYGPVDVSIYGSSVPECGTTGEDEWAGKLEKTESSSYIIMYTSNSTYRLDTTLYPISNDKFIIDNSTYGNKGYKITYLLLGR